MTVEPKTALENWISKGKVNSPKEEEQNQEFYYLSDFLKDNGFDHYEVSNFAKPGFYSRHNSSYWKYKEYLGIGPSAHSYNGFDRRSWNVANNQQYIKKLNSGLLAMEEEFLSQKDQFNEMIMIGLRTIWGVDLISLNEKFDSEMLEYFHKEIKLKLEEGILIIKENHLKIPEKHWFMADGIAADLFMV